MIKRLRRKFILISALSLLVVELLLIGSINVMNVNQLNNNEEQIMKILVDNDGKFPENKHLNFDITPEKIDNIPTDERVHNSFGKSDWLNAETRYQTRYFSVHYSESGKLVMVDTGHIAAVTSDSAVELASKALETKEQSGYVGYYKFSINQTDKGISYIFLDCQKNFETKKQLLIMSSLVGLGAYLVVCFLIVIFSKIAIRPAVKNMEMQRQFITDAGHEIKTPLAIISANTEVIEMTNGENEWTASIKNQINRLDKLIKELLSLSKMEEGQISYSFTQFCISEVVKDTAQPFETLAVANGKNISLFIDEKIDFYGDEGAVRQLTSLLVENAIKYSDDDGEIKVTLERANGHKNVKLTVSNPCSNPPEDDLQLLFERFYRADKSRARQDGKGGYGIGLSVAKAICEAHKGKISAKTDKGEIFFTAILPIRNSGQGK